MSECGIIERVMSAIGGNLRDNVITNNKETKDAVEIAMVATRNAMIKEMCPKDYNENVTTCTEHADKTKSKGPSITLAHAMSMISLFTGKVSNSYVASGVVELDGSVRMVGKCIGKCLVADRLGKGIILPEENREELETMDSAARRKLTLNPIFINSVSDLVESKIIWS